MLSGTAMGTPGDVGGCQNTARMGCGIRLADELVFGQYRIQGLPKSQTKFTVSNCTKISKVEAHKKMYNKKIYNILKVLIGSSIKYGRKKFKFTKGAGCVGVWLCFLRYLFS